MKKREFTKFTAIALSAIMMLGSSIAALASDPVTSGSVSGNGINEGHVERQVIDVVLPAVPEDSTVFQYTMDLERLIEETQAAKYAGVTLADNTGVYFSVSGNKFSSESDALTVENRSSVSVNLTVEVAASEATTDATLVSQNSFAGTDPQLYLALKVGDNTTPLEAGKTVSDTVSIAGVSDNFVLTVVSGNYVYGVKDTGTAPWATADFSLVGAANVASAKDVTAPTLTVTWRYSDASALEDCTVTYNSKTSTWWIGKSATEGFGNDATVDVTINGKAVTSNLSNGWVTVTWKDFVAAGGANADEFNIVVTADGKKYANTFTW